MRACTSVCVCLCTRAYRYKYAYIYIYIYIYIFICTWINAHTYIYKSINPPINQSIYIYTHYRSIGLVDRVFANGPGDPSSVSLRSCHTKKWYLILSCLTLSIKMYGSNVNWSNPCRLFIVFTQALSLPCHTETQKQS